MAAAFRLVQPWGRNIATESTTVSEHETATDAFCELDRLVDQMLRTGVRPDAVELIIIDRSGKRVARPLAN